MTSLGVAAGAFKPKYDETSKPLRPDSSRVGTSGNTCVRARLVTAIGRAFPDLMLPTCGGRLSNIIWVSPPRSAAVAGPAPRNGMCTTNVLVRDFSNSIDRCVEVPWPGDP